MSTCPSKLSSMSETLINIQHSTYKKHLNYDHCGELQVSVDLPDEIDKP